MGGYYYDPSWEDTGGIGRYAHEVVSRIAGMTALSIYLGAASMFAPIFIAVSVARLRRGVLFLPGYMPPLYSPIPFVFTIHDLNHVDRMENSSWLKRLYYAVVIRPACRRASYILTGSEFSRDRIVSWAGVEPAKVVNVSYGVSASYNPAVCGWEPGYTYFLCVSNRKAHKNEERVLRAFAAAKQLNLAVRLVMTGDALPEQIVLIRGLGLESRVVFRGRVPEEELPGLYRGAVALVFPSLYEGFGLPVIEAMACGIPVITSRTTALPEAAGDAALLVDPQSEGEIRDAIEKLFLDFELRQELTRRGLIHVQKFSWEETARRVQDVLEQVASSRESGNESI